MPWTPEQIDGFEQLLKKLEHYTAKAAKWAAKEAAARDPTAISHAMEMGAKAAEQVESHKQAMIRFVNSGTDADRIKLSKWFGPRLKKVGLIWDKAGKLKRAAAAAIAAAGALQGTAKAATGAAAKGAGSAATSGLGSAAKSGGVAAAKKAGLKGAARSLFGKVLGPLGLGLDLYEIGKMGKARYELEEALEGARQAQKQYEEALGKYNQYLLEKAQKEKEEAERRKREQEEEENELPAPRDISSLPPEFLKALIALLQALIILEAATEGAAFDRLETPIDLYTMSADSAMAQADLLGGFRRGVDVERIAHRNGINPFAAEPADRSALAAALDDMAFTELRAQGDVGSAFLNFETEVPVPGKVEPDKVEHAKQGLPDVGERI